MSADLSVGTNQGRGRLRKPIGIARCRMVAMERAVARESRKHTTRNTLESSALKKSGIQRKKFHRQGNNRVRPERIRNFHRGAPEQFPKLGNTREHAQVSRSTPCHRCNMTKFPVLISSSSKSRWETIATLPYKFIYEITTMRNEVVV